MNWAALSSVFLLSTFKFMFAAIPGNLAGAPFYQTYFATSLGGIFGAAVFFFSAEFFMRRAKEKRERKRQEAIDKGIPYKEKKKFTRMNKLVVKIKRSLGIYGISFWAPFFLSVPIGSVVVAKFYGKTKFKTFALICVGFFINGAVTTAITYIF